MGNMKRVQKEIKYILPIKPIVCPTRLYNLVEDTKVFIENGFPLIGQSLLREDIGKEVWTEDTFREYEEQLFNLSNYYAELLNKKQRAVISILLDPILSVVKKVNVACWAGRTGLAIDYLGDIYPCARFKETYDKMGNVSEPFFYDTELSPYEIKNAKHLTCPSDCSLLGCCAGGCKAAQRELMGSVNIPYPPVCRMYKITNKIAIDFFNRMKNNDVYLDILNKGLGYK